MKSAVHFYDQFTAQLFLDNGKVMEIGDPDKFEHHNHDAEIAKLERVLKATGQIGCDDSVMTSLH